MLSDRKNWVTFLVWGQALFSVTAAVETIISGNLNTDVLFNSQNAKKYFSGLIRSLRLYCFVVCLNTLLPLFWSGLSRTEVVNKRRSELPENFWLDLEYILALRFLWAFLSHGSGLNTCGVMLVDWKLRKWSVQSMCAYVGSSEYWHQTKQALCIHVEAESFCSFSMNYRNKHVFMFWQKVWNVNNYWFNMNHCSREGRYDDMYP